MICRVRELATCLPLPLGLVAVLARPVAADSELLRCPSVPAPQAAARPVSPAVGALDTFRPRDSRSAARPPVASPLGVAPAFNITWDPVHLIGFSSPGLIADPGRDRLLICGGLDADGNLTADVWTKPLSGAAPWALLDISGPRPPARSAHAAIYDPV